MELDEGFSEFAEQAFGQVKRSPLAIRFYVEAVENPAKSKKEGRPIFEDTEMIEIRIPGDRDIRMRPVTDADRKNHPQLYEAFKRGQDQSKAEGTVLREWPAIRRAEAEMLMAVGIRTVEHLANAADSQLQQLGPMMGLRQKARDWLKRAEGAAIVSQLRSENDDLKARLSALEQMVTTQSREIEAARNNGGVLPQAAPPDPQIAELKAQMAAFMAAVKPESVAAPTNGTPPKRRGRPPGSKNKPKVAPPEG